MGGAAEPDNAPEELSGSSTRTFFRLVKHDPPKLDEFRSHQALGVTFRRPLDPEAFRISFGVSVSDDAPKLRAQVAANPRLGAFVAVLRISDGGPVRWEKTTRRRDHYTLWGAASDILSCVERVEPV